MGHLESGKRVVILDAPTGSGKTLIGEVVRRLMGSRQCLYVCNNIALQHQFLGDFPYAKLLKGRSNYPTLNHPDDFPEVSAADCNRSGNVETGYTCDECWATEQCPYLHAREEAELSPLAVLNTAYLLTAANKARMFTDRDLIICDEADQLEGELMRHVEVVVTRGLRNWLKIDLPPEVNNMEVWGEWLMGVSDKVRDKAVLLSSRDRKERRRKKSLLELVEKIREVVPTLNDDWVVDGYEDARRKRGTTERQTVTFKPVHVREHGVGHLWEHGRQFLLMSATIISPAQLAADLGLKDHEWASVSVPSVFPAHRRPVFLDRHVGPVVKKTEETARPKLVEAIGGIAEEWDDERILVHTHSYALTQYLLNNLSLPRPIMGYMSSRERDGILLTWQKSSNGILLAPSFDRGVDLPYDACRVQILAKAPFPYLGDKQVSKRLRSNGGQSWYVIETVRSIVQATGRVMRAEDDFGATYCLDGSIWRLLGENGQYFPSWWREAVVKGLDSQSREIKAGFEGVVMGG